MAYASSSLIFLYCAALLVLAIIRACLAVSDVAYVLDAQMYRCHGDSTQPDLLSFAVDGYRDVEAEVVPPPTSLVADLWEQVLDYRDRHWNTVRMLPICIQDVHNKIVSNFNEPRLILSLCCRNTRSLYFSDFSHYQFCC